MTLDESTDIIKAFADKHGVDLNKGLYILDGYIFDDYWATLMKTPGYVLKLDPNIDFQGAFDVFIRPTAPVRTSGPCPEWIGPQEVWQRFAEKKYNIKLKWGS